MAPGNSPSVEIGANMTDLNKVTLIGRLTKDIDVGYTQNGAAIGKFSLAVNRSRNGANGKVDEVSYFNCKIFGKLAETMKPYLLKGKQIGITGYLKQERWEKDGQSQSMVTVGVEEIELLGKKENQSESNGYGGYDAYGYGE
jgi:single-strand DNA-binding protein